MRNDLLILLFVIGIVNVHAQKLNVESFVAKTNDITARTQPRQDINGNDCALIKVQLAASGAEFGGNVVSNVSYNKSEYLVYMSQGSKRLSVKLDGYLPLEACFEEYGIKALEGKTTYVMTISGASVARQIEAPKIKTGWIVLESEPSGASVFINDEFVGNTPLSNYKQAYGTYQYRLESPNYHPATGTIELKTGRFEQKIALKPAFGSISVKSNIAGAKIVLDGKQTGKQAPATLTEIPSGSHTVSLQMDKYAPRQLEVMVEDGQTANVSLTLDARYARITINSLDGAEIYSNGKLLGKGHISEDMMEGYYDLEARLNHHKPVTKQIQVVAGQSQEVTLNPIPKYGSLDVISNPHGADITIDGKSYGKTPFTIEQLLEGEHQVFISKSHFAPETRTINVIENVNTPLAIDLRPNFFNMKIVYVEADSLMTQYVFAKEYSMTLQRKSDNARNTLKLKDEALQAAKKNFQQKLNNNGFTSREQAASQQAALERQQRDFQELRTRLDDELANETTKFNETLHDSLQNFLKVYNKDNIFHFILTKKGDNILMADKKFDITSDVINGLNMRYHPAAMKAPFTIKHQLLKDDHQAENLKIAYVEVDSLMTQYDFAKEYSMTLKKKSDNARNTLKLKDDTQQAAVKNFQQKLNNNGFTSREQAASQQAALERQQRDLQELRTRLENELANETTKFNETLHDSLQNFLKDYNKDNIFHFILTKQGDNILMADNKFDITSDVINGLNMRYHPAAMKTPFTIKHQLLKDNNQTETIKIAYVEVDSLMTQYDFAKEYSMTLKKMSDNARNTLTQKGNVLQTEVNSFQQKLNNNGFTSREQAVSQQAAIERQQRDLQELQARLENEFANEIAKFNEALRDSLQSYLKEYNKSHQFSMILTKQGDNILMADKQFNITSDVINDMNKLYRKRSKK